MPLTRRAGHAQASLMNGGKAMANETRGGARGIPWRVIGWGTAALLVILPAVAMQFTAEVNWTVGDFLFAALLIGVVGVTFELTVRVTRNWAHRSAVVAALAASFLTIWANGAVGMIGSEDNPYNLLFLGVLFLALAGAILARFRPGGMAGAMGAAAIAQVAVAAGGLTTDVRGAIFSAGFAGLWLLSAALFRQAAREQASA